MLLIYMYTQNDGSACYKMFSTLHTSSYLDILSVSVFIAFAYLVGLTNKRNLCVMCIVTDLYSTRLLTWTRVHFCWTWTWSIMNELHTAHCQTA